MLEVIREEEELERINLVLCRHLNDFVRQHIAVERVQLTVVNVTTLYLAFHLSGCSDFLGVRRGHLKDDLAFDCFTVAIISTVNVVECTLV